MLGEREVNTSVSEACLGGIGPSAGALEGSGRWELLRALGAMAMVEPPLGDPLAEGLGLPAWTPGEHTRAFVLELAPFASIYLGPEGKLGGEGADRVAGMWRTLGLSPPADADHLGALLALYAELGEAGQSCRGEGARARLSHARTVVFWEHLWSWVPGYLHAVSGLAGPARAWAHLAAEALGGEAANNAPASVLALALRESPLPLSVEEGLGELADTLTVPVRTGFLLTQGDLATAASSTGLGLRRGERRFVLQAMLEQSPGAILGWLAEHASRWAAVHRSLPSVGLAPGADPRLWWSARAEASAGVLARLATAPARPFANQRSTA